MSHKIDLKNQPIRTDLAVELIQTKTSKKVVIVTIAVVSVLALSAYF